MRNVVALHPKPVPRPTVFLQQLCPGTHKQVTLLLEAADEATLAGKRELAESLVGKAREMVDDLLRSMGVAA
jgi:hypothetical protein